MLDQFFEQHGGDRAGDALARADAGCDVARRGDGREPVRCPMQMSVRAEMAFQGVSVDHSRVVDQRHASGDGTDVDLVHPGEVFESFPQPIRCARITFETGAAHAQSPGRMVDVLRHRAPQPLDCGKDTTTLFRK